jgi:hypothetical protein
MRVLFVVLLLAVTGCTVVSRSGPEPEPNASVPTSTEPSISAQEVAVYAPWVDAVCGAYTRWTQVPPPPVPPVRDAVEEDRAAVSAYLTAHVDLLTELLGMFQNLPPAPTTRTQELVDKEVGGINEALTPMRDLAGLMEFMPVDSFDDVTQLASATVRPNQYREPTLETLLDEDLVLAQAHDEAPNC